MRAVGSGTKKLIVAFHFYLFSNQAGWKCDACRKAGLEGTRRCAWAARPGAGARPVWARRRIASKACPKSSITAQSLAWLEEFLVRRQLGGLWNESLGARQAEAFLILEAEWQAETKDGNRQPAGID